jgi:hypothetical protein
VTTFAGHFLGPGTHAARPATTGLPEGTMYVCTTHAKIERVVSAAWADYATLAAGAGGDIEVKVVDDATILTTGDGKAIICIPASLGGCNLTGAHAFVTTVSSSGSPTVQIRNITQSADMLTTKITIDASEFSSYTAAAAPVIDTGNDDVATGDLIAVDVDGAGSGAKGLGVILTFALP